MFAKKDIRLVLVGLLSVAATVFYTLLLVGCTSSSPGLPGLHVVSLANNHTGARVHVGLFGLCAGFDADDADGSSGTSGNMTCAATVGAVVASGNGSVSSTKYYLPGTTTAAVAGLQPLLALAASVQSSSTGAGGVLAVVYVPLFLSALAFACAAASLLAHRLLARSTGSMGDPDDDDNEKSGLRRGHARAAAFVLATVAVMSAAAAAIATTAAVRALLFAGTSLPGVVVDPKSSTAVVVKGGTAVQVLEWLLVALLLLWHPVLDTVYRRIF